MKKIALISIMTAALAVPLGAAASAAAVICDDKVVRRSVRKRKTVLSLSIAALLAAAMALAVATAQPAQAVPSEGEPCSRCHGSTPRPPTPPGVHFDWQVVVNNGVEAPGDSKKRTFNSYNPPSLNVDRLVVFRARTKGGMGGGGTSGQPVHGVFTRDMAGANAPVVTLFDRTTAVPQPNNLTAKFIEPPSFPRIDMWSDTVASRGNHQPVWRYPYTLPGATEPAGTTGIYTNPFGSLIAGTSNLGAVPEFAFFAVPGIEPAVKFDVFPGAPAVTDHATVVFKGNYTEGGVSKTGVYYRDLADAQAGGTAPAKLIANTDTLIPGTAVPFGSTAPPSAAGRWAVFAGFDNEANPTEGGIYLAPLSGENPELTPLVEIGAQVPGEKRGTVFNKLGEGVSFDGRFVAFWGAWGSETKDLVLQCPEEGNAVRLAYCRQLYPNGFATTVPINQGVFVYDTFTGVLSAVAKTPADFDDFVYWNFSGRVPGMGEGGEGDDDTGEPARWRSATFLAVSGLVDGMLRDATFDVAFKARSGEVVDGAYVAAVDGIYLCRGPGKPPIATLVQTGMDGALLDPAAAAPVTEMGLERDGFRGDALVINARMGSEDTENGWAGIYLTTVPRDMR